jgi:hypothetical protein
LTTRLHLTSLSVKWLTEMKVGQISHWSNSTRKHLGSERVIWSPRRRTCHPNLWFYSAHHTCHSNLWLYSAPCMLFQLAVQQCTKHGISPTCSSRC